jgi:quinol monooxygenase YgiN
MRQTCAGPTLSSRSARPGAKWSSKVSDFTPLAGSLKGPPPHHFSFFSVGALTVNTLSSALVSIAVLKAKPGKELALKQELLALVEPTRAEQGNLDYVLFQQRDEQGTFYMREAFRDQAALDAHFSMPYFQRFAVTADDLLQEPLQLIFLEQVSA